MICLHKPPASAPGSSVFPGVMYGLALLLITFQPASAQSNNSMLYVATYIDVQLNSTNQGIALMQRYREATRTEKGTSAIDVVQETGRPNHFVILELWKDESSFEAHEKAAHTVEFRTRLKAIHNSPYDQRIHRGLSIDSRTWAVGLDTVVVVTHVDVPPQRTDETEVLLKRSAEDSHKDEGSVRYDIFQQTAPRTNHFTVFAVWKDRKAFDSHEIKPHARQFREVLGPLLGAPYDERLYAPLK